jgi:uncharacterized protein (DUF1697 family)
VARPPVFVALLRAVNVGGTGKLAMQDLCALCTKAGFADAKTYIQTGNVVFKSALAGDKVRAALERALAAHMGKPVDVIVRDAPELRRVLEANPFAKEDPAKVIVLFCATPVAKDVIKDVVAPGGEKVVAGRQEVYIHYPEGMGRSKLKLPKSIGVATARNINTVARLVSMAEASPAS